MTDVRAISDVLYRHDHMGIADGAPANEYDAEAEDLAERLSTLSGVEQVTDALYAVYAHWFGREITPSRESFAGAAREIVGQGA